MMTFQSANTAGYSEHKAYTITAITNITTDVYSLTHDYYYYYYNHFMALWILSDTTQVSRYQKKHSPTHTYHGHQPSLICFLHLLRCMASSLFNLHA